MEEFFHRAVSNITRHGDTDIFPFPIENHIFFDKADEVVALLKQMNENVRVSLATNPPQNIGALAPAGYSGFRWASQIDPIWNAAYLGWVLAIAEEIEKVRISTAEERVFSYRYKWDDSEKTIFDKSIGWRQFTERAILKSQNSGYVVTCDISEFYLRINHHRLENALRHLPGGDVLAERIQPFLSNLSKTYSFGLPIGGPASRLLAELGGVDKFEPVPGGGDVDHAEEAIGELIVAGGDGAVDLEVAEHSLDAVALFIECSVMLHFHTPV